MAKRTSKTSNATATKKSGRIPIYGHIAIQRQKLAAARRAKLDSRSLLPAIEM